MNKPEPNIYNFFFSEAERLLLASHLLNFGVWEFDFQYNRLIWDNKMHDIYGVKKEDFNHHMDDFRRRVHPEDLAGAEKAMEEIISTDSPLSAQFRIIRPDGAERIIAGNVKCIRNLLNQPIRLIGINHDITEQQLLQEELVHKNEQLKKIAWMQSHEIRKPVANILGLIHLIDMNQVDLHHHELLELLKSSSEELDMIIKEIIQRTRENEK